MKSIFTYISALIFLINYHLCANAAVPVPFESGNAGSYTVDFVSICTDDGPQPLCTYQYIFTAEPEEGYRFSNWEINGITTNQNPYIIEIHYSVNGMYDEGEAFTDTLNGVYDEGEDFVDTGNGQYDLGEAFTDALNGVYDEGEDFTDVPNGQYDLGETFVDAANGVWDEGEAYIDTGNGVWDEGEEFTDALNGVYDVGEDFVDSFLNFIDPSLLNNSEQFAVEAYFVDSIIFVDKDAADGGDGTSWSTAFNNIQEPLLTANEGDQIWLKGGTYYPDEGGFSTAVSRSESFIISS